MDMDEIKNDEIGRRRALQLIGGGLGALIVAGCGGGGSAAVSSTSTSTTGTTTGSTTGTTSSTATPEGEVGPYFVDDSATGYNRSNILANIDGTSVQTGVPLTLTFYVYDSEMGDAAYQGAQIDIWHANASGLYSDESGLGTSGQSWLRGYQITDANGKVTFNTIIPGWYSGRTAHIHLRVRSSYNESSVLSDGSNTTQVFFPQALIDTLYTSVAPYNAKGSEDTTNSTDHVYSAETKGLTQLVLTGDTTSGYTATFAIYLPITSE